MRILKLNVKKYWFDMIRSRVKKEEYRELKGYWQQRLMNYDIVSRNNSTAYKSYTGFKDFDAVQFTNGYAKNAPTFLAEWKGTKVGQPKKEWCEDVINFNPVNRGYDDCFIIELGDIIK
jgi:hypothetical protein